MRTAFAFLLFTSAAHASAFEACATIDASTNPRPAIEHCTAYLDTDPQDPVGKADALSTRGIAWRAQGDLEQSLADLKAALALDSAPRHQRMLAWTYREMGDSRKAERIYSRLLKDDNDHWQTWLSRCVTRLDQENYRGAAGDCDAAILRDPTNLDAPVFGATAYNFLGNGARALPLAEAAAQKAPDQARTWREMAWAFYLLGQKQEARALAEEKLETFPEDAGLKEFLEATGE